MRAAITVGAVGAAIIFAFLMGIGVAARFLP